MQEFNAVTEAQLSSKKKKFPNALSKHEEKTKGSILCILCNLIVESVKPRLIKLGLIVLVVKLRQMLQIAATSLQLSELPVSPLQETVVKSRPGFSVSDIRSLWETAAGPPGTPTAGNNAPRGTPPQTRCPANVGAHLEEIRK